MCEVTDGTDLEIKARRIASGVFMLSKSHPRLYDQLSPILKDIQAFCFSAAEYLKNKEYEALLVNQDKRPAPPAPEYVLMRRWDVGHQWHMCGTSVQYPEVPIRESGYEYRWFKAL